MTKCNMESWRDPGTEKEYQATLLILLFNNFQDLPGGTVVKNPPAIAGDTGSSPGPGRFHMLQSNEACVPQLLSLHSRAHKPQLLKPACHNYWSPHAQRLCSATREASAMRSPHTAMKSSPRSPQLEKSPRATTKTQCSQK